MIRFRQHVPSFVDCDPFAIVVDSQEELLSHPELKDREGPGFFRWSKTDPDGKCLIKEMDEGRTWWVAGYSDTPLDLPEWVYPKKSNP